MNTFRNIFFLYTLWVLIVTATTVTAQQGGQWVKVRDSVSGGTYQLDKFEDYWVGPGPNGVELEMYLFDPDWYELADSVGTFQYYIEGQGTYPTGPMEHLWSIDGPDANGWAIIEWDEGDDEEEETMPREWVNVTVSGVPGVGGSYTLDYSGSNGHYFKQIGEPDENGQVTYIGLSHTPNSGGDGVDFKYTGSATPASESQTVFRVDGKPAVYTGMVDFDNSNHADVDESATFSINSWGDPYDPSDPPDEDDPDPDRPEDDPDDPDDGGPPDDDPPDDDPPDDDEEEDEEEEEPEEAPETEFECIDEFIERNQEQPWMQALEDIGDAGDSPHEFLIEMDINGNLHDFGFDTTGSGLADGTMDTLRNMVKGFLSVFFSYAFLKSIFTTLRQW